MGTKYCSAMAQTAIDGLASSFRAVILDGGWRYLTQAIDQLQEHGVVFP